MVRRLLAMVPYASTHRLNTKRQGTEGTRVRIQGQNPKRIAIAIAHCIIREFPSQPYFVVVCSGLI